MRAGPSTPRALITSRSARRPLALSPLRGGLAVCIAQCARGPTPTRFTRFRATAFGLAAASRRPTVCIAQCARGPTPTRFTRSARRPLALPPLRGGLPSAFYLLPFLFCILHSAVCINPISAYSSREPIRQQRLGGQQQAARDEQVPPQPLSLGLRFVTGTRVSEPRRLRRTRGRWPTPTSSRGSIGVRLDSLRSTLLASVVACRRPAPWCARRRIPAPSARARRLRRRPDARGRRGDGDRAAALRRRGARARPTRRRGPPVRPSMMRAPRCSPPDIA